MKLFKFLTHLFTGSHFVCDPFDDPDCEDPIDPCGDHVCQ